MTKKLILIAMSGVRIVDPELRALGMTLPGFIERGKVIASMPSLGLLTIAGATPDSWQIKYREVDELQPEILPKIIAEAPDLVAISSLSARIEDAYQIADTLRQAKIPVVMGGLHASVLPAEVSAHCDAVVLGQGEWVWPDLLRDLESGHLKPQYSGMHAPNALESTPLPRFDLLEVARYNRIPMQTTRGCPLDCIFCAASRLISPYKLKSLDRIRDELNAIQSIWPDPFIELADDNTFRNKGWSRDLVNLLSEYPTMRWFTETDLSLADDEALLESLTRSGCAQVLIGFESVQEDSLQDTDTRSWKRKRLAEYREKIQRIQSAGISVNGCFIFGFDADTEETFDRTWEFIQKSDLSEVQLTLLTPFPGTELYRKLRAENRLLEDRFWSKCTLFDVVFHPKYFSPERLSERFREMVSLVYSPEATQKRASLRTKIYRSKVSKS